MIPESTQIARAKEHRMGVSSTGTEHVAILFEIQDGEYKGQPVTYRGFFTEAAYRRTLEGLKYAGWDGKSLVNMRGLGSVLCQIVIEHDKNPDTGRIYPRVAWVNQLAALVVKEELGAEGIKDLEGRLRAMLKRDREAAPQSTPSDDDIPF